MARMPDPTLYLFDGYNLLHAGEHSDERELTDELASFVAMNGARGFVVFDGVGEEFEVGPLSVRYAPHADTLLERLAAEHRQTEACLPRLLRRGRSGTSGQEVQQALVGDVPPRSRPPDALRGRGVARARPDRPGDARQARAACARGLLLAGRRGPAARTRAHPNTCSNHSARFAMGL